MPGPLLKDTRGDLGRAEGGQRAPTGVADGVDRRARVDQVLRAVRREEGRQPAQVAALAIGSRREPAQLPSRRVDLALRLGSLFLCDDGCLLGLLEPEPRAVVGLDRLSHLGGQLRGARAGSGEPGLDLPDARGGAGDGRLAALDLARAGEGRVGGGRAGKQPNGQRAGRDQRRGRRKAGRSTSYGVSEHRFWTPLGSLW